MAIKDRLSIIVPTYNEESNIVLVLQTLNALSPPAFEIIVVDGGSKDETVNLVRSLDCQLIFSEKGRGKQMRAGALIAGGEHLCFVHADTFVPQNLVGLIHEALEDQKVALGAFRSVMEGPNGTRRLTTMHNVAKTWYGAFLANPYRTLFKNFRLLVGDQVMFCRSSDLEAVGGYPDQPLMEDLELSVRLNKRGKNILLPQKVFSSDRRVAALGNLRSNFLFLFLGMLWVFKVPPDFLAKLYKDIR